MATASEAVNEVVEDAKNAIQGKSSGGGQRDVNVGEVERGVSGTLGALMLLKTITHPLEGGKLINLAIGGGLLYRAITGNCALYSKLGINTAQPAESSQDQGDDEADQGRVTEVRKGGEEDDH